MGNALSGALGVASAANPLLGMIGTGLSLFGGIEGLLGASAAEHQAMVAQENAIRDFKASGDERRLNILNNGTAGLNTLSGGLGNALTNTGRSLGASLAGAGIFNSTAAAGALANQGAANAAVEGRYSQSLANTLAGEQSDTDSQVAQMRYGLATNNVNFARQQGAGSANGLASFFGNLGQQNFGSLFGSNQGGGTPGTGAPTTGSVLAPTNGLVVPSNYNLWSGSPQQPGANFGALPGGAGRADMLYRYGEGNGGGY